MISEEQLVHKSYYKTFIDGTVNVHPIKALGEMYLAEQQKEVNDLTYIRFAQGEVYFLNNDYEAAIYKWEHISNELKPWALKNIGDAHMQLDLLAIAEDYYKAVETESDVLKTEVLLELFALYIRRDNFEKAVASIKEAVQLNPDYPEVTEIARKFFEENMDYTSAMELAIKEAIRTEDLSWFETLRMYVEQGYTESLAPATFREVLKTLLNINPTRFEGLSVALWNSYKYTDYYFDWLKEINQLFIDMELDRVTIWHDLSLLYNETFKELINGKYLLKELSHIIPPHLTNWLKISPASTILESSSAAIAWNEVFPSSLDDSTINMAESMLRDAQQKHMDLEEVYSLIENMKKWAANHQVTLGNRFEWTVRKLLDLEDFHLLVTGPANSGKKDFVNTIINEDLLDGSASTTVIFEDKDQAEMKVMNDEEERTIANLHDFIQGTKMPQTLVHCHMPVDFLQENQVTLIDTPGFTDQRKTKKEVFQYLHLADAVLYVLNVESVPTFNELDMAVKMRERAPETPIHFLLYEVSGRSNQEITEKSITWIHKYFPNAKVLTFSPFAEKNSQLQAFSSFIQSLRKDYDMVNERKTKILHYARRSTQLLHNRRLELENSLIEEMNWNQEMVGKLEGALYQVSDLEEENTTDIKKAYHEVLVDLRKSLTTKIPEILKNCSELVKDDSEIEKIHVELNDEMNRRVTEFVKEEALPNLRTAIHEWISLSEQKFRETEEYLQEMRDSFNQLYGEEKLSLNCDFKVLDDWKRDVERMTRYNIELGNIRIFKRTTSSQYLLKATGTLFGALAKNKSLLQEKYKQFIETKDYREIVTSITDEFMQQFEYFEKTLDRDINMFFANTVEELSHTLKETNQTIEISKESLENKRKNPEFYQDPLSLFEVKVRQYEWMREAGKRQAEFQ